MVFRGLLNIKIYFQKVYTYIKKKLSNLNEYGVKCAGDNNAVLCSSFRIYFYFLKKIKEQPFAILVVYVIVWFFSCLWLFFILIKCSNVILAYLWYRALYTHKFMGFIFIQVLQVLMILIILFAIGIFAFYFNKLKNKIARNSAFFINTVMLVEYVCLRIIDLWEDLKTFFLLHKKNTGYAWKAIWELWAAACFYASNRIDTFRKTELYKLFMQTGFYAQIVYLFIALLGGIVLIEFLVASYWAWLVVYKWASAVFYIGSGGISKELFNCLVVAVIAAAVIITNVDFINKIFNSSLIKKLLSANDFKIICDFIKVKLNSLRLWFVYLSFLSVVVSLLYFYSCFYLIRGYENFLIITVWFCVSVLKILFLGGVVFFSWSFLKYFYITRVHKFDEKKIIYYKRIVFIKNDLLAWWKGTNARQRIWYLSFISFTAFISVKLYWLILVKKIIYFDSLLFLIKSNFEITNLIFLIILTICFLFFLAPYLGLKNIGNPKNAALIVSVVLFLLMLWATVTYDYSQGFVNVSTLFIDCSFIKSSIFCFYFNPLSLCLALLTTFIFPIAILTAWDRIYYRISFFYFNVIVLELLVLGSFFAYDIFLFFIFFEAIFIPMALIISIWGGRQKKLSASSYLVIYGLLGSTFFLAGIIYLFARFDTTNYFELLILVKELTTTEVLLLWVAFFLPFAIKIPMFPFHVWLPEAHVEAPTSGSIILAAVLLKLGGYGFIRFLLPLFGNQAPELSVFACALAIIGMFYSALSSFRQTDIKKIIAYSSIAHMNLVVLGIFSFNLKSIYGSIILMIGHGFTSAALFFLVGVLYDRYHTRTLEEFGGLLNVMPLFCRFLFFFVIANFGFPCSLGFIGEFLIFIGVYNKFGLLVSFLLGVVSIFNLCLNLYLFISICLGPLNTSSGSLFQDLSAKETAILLVLAAVSLLTLIFHSYYSWILVAETLRICLV